MNRARQREQGQVMVLLIVVSVVLFAAAVIAIDLGTYVWERQELEIAVDAAALAGGLELPESGAAARSSALEYIGLNDPDVDLADVTTTFRCLVGDRDDNGSPDASDVPAVCNPGAGASWTCSDRLCVSQCDPFTGSNRCNVIDVDATKEVSLTFTQLLGFPPVEITASRNGACKGFCGTAPTSPLDVVIVIDRSGSMSSSELTDAKNGALAVLEIFDPQYQHVALAVLGTGNPSDVCEQIEPDHGGDWLIVPLSDDYKNADGTLNSSSDLVSIIQCIGTSSQGTNLGSPLSDSFYNRADALEELLNSGQEGATQGIILFSDGAANEPDPMAGDDNPCQYAYDRAAVVKGNDIEVFTIGYGVQSEYCDDDSGAYNYERVTELLANMATDSADDQGHCANAASIAAENGDGDHFLCQAEGGDLDFVFVTAASALAPGVRLIGAP
ncbi:MAG: vWA domain-containing protein [Anaerolineales bacterium]